MTPKSFVKGFAIFVFLIQIPLPLNVALCQSSNDAMEALTRIEFLTKRGCSYSEYVQSVKKAEFEVSQMKPVPDKTKTVLTHYKLAAIVWKYSLYRVFTQILANDNKCTDTGVHLEITNKNFAEQLLKKYPRIAQSRMYQLTNGKMIEVDNVIRIIWEEASLALHADRN